jgi:hypothetical protein
MSRRILDAEAFFCRFPDMRNHQVNLTQERLISRGTPFNRKIGSSQRLAGDKLDTICAKLTGESYQFRNFINVGSVNNRHILDP